MVALHAAFENTICFTLDLWCGSRAEPQGMCSMSVSARALKDAGLSSQITLHEAKSQPNNDKVRGAELSYLEEMEASWPITDAIIVLRQCDSLKTHVSAEDDTLTRSIQWSNMCMNVKESKLGPVF